MTFYVSHETNFCLLTLVCDVVGSVFLFCFVLRNQASHSICFLICFCFCSIAFFYIFVSTIIQTRQEFYFVLSFISLQTGEMLADSTVTVSGLSTQPGGGHHAAPPPFLLPPPRGLIMNPAAYLAAPFLYGNNALRY